MQQNYPSPHHPLKVESSGQAVSINLLTYNAEKYIEDCLNSVFRQSYPHLEVLIIDNNSTDGTKDYLKGLTSKPKLRIIFNQQNVGFAVGHNQGIKKSQGEFILCLNQDVVLDKDFIEKAVAIFKENKKAAAVQGKLLRFSVEGQTSKVIDTTGLVILKNRRIIARGQGQVDQGQFEKKEEIFGVDGAVPVYRRKALTDVKINEEYFDEDFFCYKEDVDLAWRLRLYGWQTIYQPRAIAWHWRGSGDSATRTPWGIVKERKKISQFSKYLSFKNQRLMQLKNEQIWLLIKHLPWFLSKEIAAWFYILLFEKYTWPAIKDLFRQMPRAWQKRKIIIAKRRVGAKEMERWFA
jgi:GT2 family glycosyltransferase